MNNPTANEENGLTGAKGETNIMGDIGLARCDPTRDGPGIRISNQTDKKNLLSEGLIAPFWSSLGLN